MRRAPWPTTIRLPAELKRRLKAMADERRQPLSLLIVYVLEQWAKHQEPPKRPELEKSK